MAYTDLKKLSFSSRQEVQSIYENRFHSEAATHLPISIHGYPAFFLVTPDVLRLTNDILRLENPLSMLIEALPKGALAQYRNTCLISEIILTNDIENVHSSRREISDILQDLSTQDTRKRFRGLVNKYTMLLGDAPARRLQTCQDIRDIFDELVANEISEDAPDHLPDGRFFRSDAVTVYSQFDKPIHTGLYPETEIMKAMELSLQIVNDESIDILLRIAVFHYLFGYIHPFYDGNGRVNRFISSCLISDCLNPLAAFHLSLTIKQQLTAYYKAFETCNSKRNRGDLTPFILMFLRVIFDSGKELAADLSAKVDKWNHYHELAGAAFPSPVSETAQRLVQAALFSEDGIPTDELLDSLKISRTTLASRLKRIPEGLYSIQKIKNIKYYRMNLRALESYANTETPNPS